MRGGPPAQVLGARALFVAALVLLAATSSAYAQTAPITPPADIAARGHLTIALFAAFPPMAYKDPNTGELMGIDIDLANYLERKMGVRVEWQEVSYESAVNSLITGRVDMAFSLLDAPEAADKLDYVPYLTSGMQPYTLATHAPIATARDMCGLKVGANRRNGFDATMRKWSDANCTAAGLPALQVQETDGTPAARLQLAQGRVDIAVQSSESMPYTMSREKGLYVKIGKPLTSLLIVAAFPKSATGLRDAVALALKDAVADGSYAAALARHGLEDNSAAVIIERKR